MKLLVTGVKGQLGYDVIQQLEQRGLEYVATDRENMDITDYEQVKSIIIDNKVDAVIHCAAYTAVDAAEDNQDQCRLVNVQGTRNIAQVCKELDIKMVYISTDYVFDGQGNEPWDTNSKRKPLNVYGQTKYEGELVVEERLKKYFIVRTSWVFGENGNNFVKTMIYLGKTKKVVKVINDQFGSPTYTYDLAKSIVDMVLSDKYGIYHVTNEGDCSWYEFACKIFKIAKMEEVKVIPVDSSSFSVKAKRPFNSRLSKDKLEQMGFERLPSWQNALERYVKKA
jgi:dTDP-4-dehydrorhamnose reductase